MEKHHSCLNTRAIIEYFQKKFPDRLPLLFEDLGPEIEALPNPQEFLMDINNWVSSEVTAKMFDNARCASKDDQIAFKIGFDAVSQQRFGYVQRIIILAFGSPRRAVKKIQAISNKFSRNKVFEVLYAKRQGAGIRIHWLKHIPTHPDFCLFNQGICTGMPLIWGLSPMSLEETKCFFKGDPYCEWHGIWEKKSLFKNTFRRIFMPWSLLRESIEELERDKELLIRKFDEVHHLNVELKKKMDQLMALPETCIAALSVLNLEGLLQAVMRILINFARLDRAGILLLNEDESVLEVKYAVGIEPELLQQLSAYKIPLTKVDNLLARAAIMGLPVLVPDVAQSKLNLDNPLIQALKPKSFIAAPLSVRGKVLGVLVADRVRQDRAISDIDKEFVLSFANQIAMTLENALLYQKLEMTERRYRELVENAHEGIWIIDERGQIKFANRRLREITGYLDLQGKSCYELFDAGNKMELVNTIAQNQEGRVVEKELQLTARNSSLIAVLMSSVPLMENERYVGAFAMFNDITEKKRMEQQLIEHKKMEAITTLSEGIAHNFNDILMNIMGLTGLLLADTSPSQSAQADLKQIEQEVLKGSELTRQLLAFRHREHYVPKITDLNLLLDKVAKLFSQNKKGVAINKNLAAHLPAVEVDQGQIEQALMNLLLIAWEARSGPGELLLSSEEVLLGEEFCQLHGRKPGRYVYVQLTDSGIRDAEQTRAKIFEPFLTPPKIGLDPGLGLTSIYAIVKRHEGIIIVDDDQDEGVTFHLYLPVTQKILLTERAPAPRYIKGTGTILLVDDDDSVRAMESRMLERLGYKVIPVDTGSQAVSLYQNRQEPIDLVILDMVMPEMGGREVYHHLKKIDPQVKVMLYSGHTMDEDVYGLLEEGALGYIQKPYSLSEFSQKLADALNLPQPKLELLPQEAKSFAGDRQKPKKGKPAL